MQGNDPEYMLTLGATVPKAGLTQFRKMKGNSECFVFVKLCPLVLM